MAVSPTELLDIARTIALEAGELIARRRSEGVVVADTKSSSIDVVTFADRECEEFVKSRLAELRPEDGFYGEEGGDSTGTSGLTWIVDPIDGTANYLRGVPIWATLIALRVDGVITTSVVSAPALGRRWWAHRGNGAFTMDIDGGVRALQVSKISNLEDSSISYNNMQLWDQSGKLPQLIDLSRKVWRTRAYGDFYSYMLLAEGSIDLVAEHDLKIYDIAALVPIVELAGGQFTALDGPLTAESSSVLATNGKLHQAVARHF